MKELRKLVKDYDLCGAELLDRYSDAELKKIYNGAGPDSWIPLARDVLTTFMRLFKPVMVVHDVMFFESDGKEASFDKTVDYWVANTRKIFNAEYPLTTWKMLKSSYRKERAYWYGVMKISNIAINTTAAKAAYLAAWQKRKAER